MYKKLGKRVFDFILSLTLIVLFFPIFLCLYCLVFFIIGRPVLFAQDRPGRQEKILRLYKFRTMTNEKDDQGNLLPDADRLTKCGIFLRKTSLDELPSLFNVLKGDMSLVGPRPLLVQYLPIYSLEQAKRHDVHPGITGWAQVNGRNAISWKEKFRLDVWYAEHMSFLLDIKILYLTVLKVIRRSDINQEGEATASFFNGSN